MMEVLTNASLRRKYSTKVPYDYSDPAVEENEHVKRNENEKKRTGAYCQFDFVAINSKETHQKFSNSRPKYVVTTVPEKQTTDVSEKCKVERPARPSRLKARLGVELFCLIDTQDL